jgi:predicted Zn-dependent peptidase
LEFREHTLDNGLEIVAECNPQAYSTAVGFFVKTGSRDESDANHGVSHFLEHMMFKGTARRSAADVNRELDEIGSHSNAFTSEEQTAYFAAFLPEYQERAIDLLSDILRPALREDDFAMEKKVILEEIAKYEDQPPFGAHEKCMALHFGTHPLGRSVLGTAASVTALTREQMLAYFRQRYSPGNIALVAAGKVDFERLLAQAQRHCGGWDPCATSRATPPVPRQRGHQVLQRDNATQQYVVQISGAPGAHDAERYAGRLLATILGDSSGSRLYWELFDPGLAECAVLETYDYQGAGIFLTYLCCMPEDAAGNLEVIDQIYRAAHATGVTEDELKQAQSKIRSHIVLQAERPANRLFSVGNNWVQRRQYRTVRETLASYEAVTAAHIAAVLEKYPLCEPTTVAVGPLPELALASR